MSTTLARHVGPLMPYRRPDRRAPRNCRARIVLSAYFAMARPTPRHRVSEYGGRIPEWSRPLPHFGSVFVDSGGSHHPVAELVPHSQPGLHTPIAFRRRARPWRVGPCECRPWGVVVSSSFANRYWPGEDPLGKRGLPRVGLVAIGRPTREGRGESMDCSGSSAKASNTTPGGSERTIGVLGRHGLVHSCRQ